jgi:hypothetical protein
MAGAKLANQNQNLQTAFPQFHSVQVFRTRRQTHLSTLLLTWEAWWGDVTHTPKKQKDSKIKTDPKIQTDKPWGCSEEVLRPSGSTGGCMSCWSRENGNW